MEQLQYLKPSLLKRQKRRDKRLGEEVIECYRVGSRSNKMKGYNKKFLKSGFEDTHQHESIKFMHAGGTKNFNDNLEPLMRFLVSHVGKNWDKVHAELCSKLNKNTVNGLHVFNHLFDFVQLNTVMENKKIYYYWYGRKFELLSIEKRPRFYIDHKTRQLRKAPKSYKRL